MTQCVTFISLKNSKFNDCHFKMLIFLHILPVILILKMCAFKDDNSAREKF